MSFSRISATSHSLFFSHFLIHHSLSLSIFLSLSHTTICCLCVPPQLRTRTLTYRWVRSNRHHTHCFTYVTPTSRPHHAHATPTGNAIIAHCLRLNISTCVVFNIFPAEEKKGNFVVATEKYFLCFNKEAFVDCGCYSFGRAMLGKALVRIRLSIGVTMMP